MVVKSDRGWEIWNNKNSIVKSKLRCVINVHIINPQNPRRHTQTERSIDSRERELRALSTKQTCLFKLRYQIATHTRSSLLSYDRFSSAAIAAARAQNPDDQKMKINFTSILTSSFVNEETIKTVECYWKDIYNSEAKAAAARYKTE